MEKKIKILHILPSLTRGGAEKVCYDILSNLNREKFFPSLILFKDNQEGIKWKKDLKDLNIPFSSYNKKYLFDIYNFWQIYKEIKKINPDIVHTHLGADIYGRIAAYLAGVKIIISTEHNINVSEKKIIGWLKKITSYMATKVFAVSQAVKDNAILRYKLGSNKVAVIYNGVDTDYFFPTEKEKEINHNRDIIIGGMGRLSRQKGFSILIEAAKNIKHKNYKIIIAGQGELELDLKKQINTYGLQDKVILEGKVEARSFLNKIDIFVFPSLWEGLGIALLEAAAMKKVIIASKTGGIKEIITSDSGFLFQPGDADGLANKINYVISNLDKEEITSRVEKARKLVENRFSLKKMVSDYTLWYENLFNKR